MKKKVLILFCSPHPEGHSQKLLNTFLEMLDPSQLDITRLNIYAENIQPCIGCKFCGQHGKCFMRDFDKIDSLLRSSDLLIVASPIYNSSFPSPFKAVLDRTQQYYETRFSLKRNPPISKHRKAVLLLTQGSEEPFGPHVTQKQLERSFSVMNTKLVGKAVHFGTDNSTDIPPETYAQLTKLCKNI